MTNARWIGVAEQAKLVRSALKLAFPMIKFSVRSKSYSGGAHITISWTDGPTTRDVESITQAYAGGGFDGSIDLAYHYDHYLLLDGTVMVASSPGTVGSMGYVLRIDEQPMPAGAERVSFHASHIFASQQTAPTSSGAGLRRSALATVGRSTR